jgi:hypothetical protein
MSLIIWAAIAAYTVIFCSIPILRSEFLYNSGKYILFWILAVEYIVMIPISIKAFMALMNNTHSLLSFCISAFVTSFILFLAFIFLVNGMPDRGMGVIVFLLFPLIDAALAASGAICGLIYIVKKVINR